MEELVLFSCSSWCQWLPAGPDLTFSSAARHVVTFIPLSNTRSLYRCPIHRSLSDFLIYLFFYLFIFFVAAASKGVAAIPVPCVPSLIPVKCAGKYEKGIITLVQDGSAMLVAYVTYET